MNRDELDEIVEKAMEDFLSIEGVSEDLADALVGQGFLSFDDLSIIEPSDLMSLGSLTEEQVEAITQEAERLALEEEAKKAEIKRLEQEELKKQREKQQFREESSEENNSSLS